jgi:hypothetical protein
MKFLGKPLLAMGIAVVLGALVWAGGLLYWTLRIGKAIRTLEEGTTLSSPTSNHLLEVPPAADQVLGEAGCRALPYLVRTLDPAKEPPFLLAASTRFVETLNLEPAVSKEDCDLRYFRRARFIINLDDSPEIRRNKCAAAKDWWHVHAGEFHQWWRFWSSWCGKKED